MRFRAPASKLGDMPSVHGPAKRNRFGSRYAGRNSESYDLSNAQRRETYWSHNLYRCRKSMRG